jgi:hypothetical protein
VTAPTPAEAAVSSFVTGCVARGITASVAVAPSPDQFEAARGLWADVARDVVAAYVNANGGDPVDARSVILEAAGLPVVTAGRLAAALKGRLILVDVDGARRAVAADGMWLVPPARPHDLAVELLTAIDPRLTDNPGREAAEEPLFPGGDPRDDNWIGGYRPGIEGD